MKLRFRLATLIVSLVAAGASTSGTVLAASATPSHTAAPAMTSCCWDHRDHRGWDHRDWRGRDWDHRGWGWGWESQCDWAWHHDRDWWWRYCS